MSATTSPPHPDTLTPPKDLYGNQLDKVCVSGKRSRHSSDYCNGYCPVRKKNVGAHVLACESLHGPRPSKSHTVNHKCNNRWCCEPTHTEWMRSSDQSRKINQPRRKAPVRRGREIVREVTTRYLIGGHSSTALSEEYGIESSLIRDWGRGKRRPSWTEDIRARAGSTSRRPGSSAYARGVAR